MLRYALTIVLPTIAAAAISLTAGHFLVPFLAKLKMGQTEREEGVKAHLSKAGTPTMGGLIFLIAALLVGLFYLPVNPKIFP